MRDLRRLDELGLRLTELGSEIAYPSPTRDLWPAVREGIGTRRVSWWSPVARVALGAAVVLLVLAIGLRQSGLPSSDRLIANDQPIPQPIPQLGRALDELDRINRAEKAARTDPAAKTGPKPPAEAKKP